MNVGVANLRSVCNDDDTTTDDSAVCRAASGPYMICTCVNVEYNPVVVTPSCVGSSENANVAAPEVDNVKRRLAEEPYGLDDESASTSFTLIFTKSDNVNALSVGTLIADDETAIVGA